MSSLELFSIANWWKPAVRSSVDKHAFGPTCSKISVKEGSQYLLKGVTVFSCLKSTQMRTLPSFLRTGTSGLAHAEVDSTIMPSFNNFSISLWTASLIPAGICLGGRFTTAAPSERFILQVPAEHKPGESLKWSLRACKRESNSFWQKPGHLSSLT